MWEWARAENHKYSFDDGKLHYFINKGLYSVTFKRKNPGFYVGEMKMLLVVPCCLYFAYIKTRTFG